MPDTKTVFSGRASISGKMRCMHFRMVSHIHLRHLNPLPRNLGNLFDGFDKILVPEMNTGQLVSVLRDRLLIDAIPLNKVSGQPFKISEILDAIRDKLLAKAAE